MKIQIQIIQTAGSDREPDGWWSASDENGDSISRNIVESAIEHKTRSALEDYNLPIGEIKMWRSDGGQLDGSETRGIYEVAF